MESAVVYLERCPEYRLEGDIVHITSFSGNETFHKVLSINQFMAAHAASQRIINEWSALQNRPALVLPFRQEFQQSA